MVVVIILRYFTPRVFYPFSFLFACPIVGMFHVILISNFRRVLNVVCFLLGDSPPSEIYVPTFRNTLSHLHRQVGVCRMN